MIPVGQPKLDTHWLPLTRKTGMAARGRQSLATARKLLGSPAERAACRQRWSLTSVSLRLTNGISDLEASSAKGLLAEVFVCKIGMLMRPSNGFFFIPYTLETSVGRREGRNPLLLGRKNVSTVPRLSLM